MSISINKKSRTLFLFIDESGNVDFDFTGTKHFVMAGVYTFTPGTIQHLMQELRYELMEVGHDISEFHASQDRQSTRNRVFDLLQDIYGLGANIVYGKKSLIVEHDRSDVRLHAKFGLQLVESVVSRVV